MIKRGYPSCPACHADPSGGELLTAYGRMISTLTLSTNWSGDGGSGANEHGLSRKLALRGPESFAAGPKGAGPEAGEATPGEGDKAEGDKAEGDKSEESGDAKEDEAKADDEESASAEASAAPAASSSSSSSDSGESKFPNFLFGAFDLPEWLLLGGSYRHMNIITPAGSPKFRTFPMMMDLYGQAQFGAFKFGGSIGGARVPAGSPYARSAQVTANQGDQWNLISRTHYVGYDFSTDLSVRAGRLNLPFGVRIPEHTMWVRQATRTDRESAQQHGVSINYTTQDYRFELMGIAGNYQINPDKFRERGYSGYFEYFTTPKTSIGITSLITVAKEDKLSPGGGSTTRMAHGGMFRTAIGEKTVFVAEVDALSRSRREVGYVGFAQLDVEPTQGVHFMAAGEMLDEGHPNDTATNFTPRSPGLGKPRVGGWLSAAWWPVPHFDIRIDGVQRTGDDFQLFAQLHVYL
jgi:hypothetical protein